MLTNTGVVQFSAPEIFDQNNTGYDEKVDVWSAGIVFYMMLAGIQPFVDEDVSKIPQKIKEQEPDYDLEPFQKVNPLCVDLLQKMLLKDPSERPSAEECLEHPWFNLDFTPQNSANRTVESPENLLSPETL